MKLRGIEKCENSFMWSIVSPIYKPRDADVKSVAWIVTIILWLVTLSKVWKRPGMIKHVFGGAFVKPDEPSQNAVLESVVTDPPAAPQATRA